jgi:predicted dehydrogenase
VAPAVALAELGYHLIVEKPMAPDEQGCRTLVHAVEKAGVMVAVCHVMRYTPYTRLLKEIVDSGRIGPLVSAAPGAGRLLAPGALLRPRQLAP